MENDVTITAPMLEALIKKLPLTNTEILSLIDVLQKKQLEIAHKVFHEDILDKILHFAIYDDNKLQRMERAHFFNLVQRHWRDRVSEVLQRLPHDTYDVDSEYDDLDRFVSIFGNSPANRIPPFALTFTVYSGCVVTENIVTQFGNCLSRCGTGIVNLTFQLLETQPFVFPLINSPLRLPKLKEISVYPSESEMLMRSLPLLRSVLLGCESLKSFELVNARCEEEQELVAADIQLELPKSVTDVRIDFEYSAGNLTRCFLGNNSLPNLTSLSLFVSPLDFDVSNELAAILDHYCHQLKKLHICGYKWEISVSPGINIILPVFECLEKFNCSANNHDLQALITPPPLEGCFPKLKKFKLRDQSFNMLQKWLEISRCSLVEQVNIPLVPPATWIYKNDVALQDQAYRLKRSFPNVIHLSLDTVCTSHMSHLKVIFRTMRQLQYLYVKVKECPADVSRHVFNGVLIGVGQEEAAALENQDVPSNPVDVDYELLPYSIVHLTELTALNVFVDGLPNSELPKLVADAAYKYAFMKMSKLRNLYCSGLFEPSPIMAQRWEQHCRERDGQ